MEEGIKEEEGLEDSANEEEEETQEDWSDHFVEFKKKRATRKKIMKKISSGHRLYAIDRRRGESIATGLYLETWNKLEFIVSGYSKNRYKKVRSEKEGVGFIRDYYCAKVLGKK